MDESEDEAKQTMKQGLKQHVDRFLKTKYENELSGHVGMEKLIKQWEEWEDAGDTGRMDEKTKALFVELLESQRQYLMQLNETTNIDEELIRQRIYQIDLEEERIKLLY